MEPIDSCREKLASSLENFFFAYDATSDEFEEAGNAVIPVEFQAVFSAYDEGLVQIATYIVRCDPTTREEDLPAEEGEVMTYGDCVLWILQGIGLCYLRQAYNQVPQFMHHVGHNLVIDMDALHTEGVTLKPSDFRLKG